MAKLKGEDTMTEQAYRYPKDTWSEDEARSHCDSHGGKFEAARDDKKANLNDSPVGDKNKEEKTMNLEEIRSKEPALYAEIIDLGKAEGKKEMQTILVEKDKEITSLTEKNKQLEKDLTIEKANVQAEKETVQAEKDKVEADKIMDAILAESTVTETIYEKIRPRIDHKTFKTDKGAFDSEGFKKAFQAEVKDWEDRLPKGGLGLGLKDPKIEGGDLESDIAMGRELARSVTGHIRSDG